ncbi:tubulin-folding cofactor B [Drosophila pseudoobscura]|uniref:Tubulin-folding cofactor B n=1 Tax=Drosophila pseudoobscura pseudoobscura TaxID=46245 RepID=A0A6I8UUA2_DROPS|nr:tubulin-folding cofactor B [Drosophila pseudoobscura]
MADLIKLGKSDYIKANVSNSHNDAVAFEVKLAKDLTISALKSKLEILTGGSAGTMKVELYKGDKCLGTLDNNDAQLGYYASCDGLRLHVIDTFASFCFDAPVEKFELSKDQYDKRSDSVRHYLKQNRLGKYNEEEMQQIEEKKRQQAEEVQKRAELCVVDKRCEVTVQGNPRRRGTIKYNGPLEGKSGIFIGIQYDEPLGKNNGSVNGKVYFVCPPNYGGFVSPLSVTVGDFPPEDFNLDEEL